MSDKKPTSPIAASKLPAPLTFSVGDGDQVKVNEVEADKVEEVKEEAEETSPPSTKVKEEKVENEEDVLPMPIAFGDDEEEETENKVAPDSLSSIKGTEIAFDAKKNDGDEADNTTKEDEEEIVEVAPVTPEVKQVEKISRPLSPKKIFKPVTEVVIEEESEVMPVSKKEKVEVTSIPVVQDSVENDPQLTNIRHQVVETEEQSPHVAEPEVNVEKEVDFAPEEKFDIPQIKTSPIEHHIDRQKPTPSEVNTISHAGGYQHQASPVNVAPIGAAVAPSLGQATINSFPEPRNNSKSNPLTKITIGLALLLVGGAIVVGGYFASSKLFADPTTSTITQQAITETLPPVMQQPVVTPAPVATPTPEPAPEIELDKVSIRLLNGSGVKGAANKAKALLKDENFEDIKTGNADNFDYTKTTVDYKGDYESLVTVVKKAMKGSYVVVKGEELDDDNKYDLVITLGSEEEEKSNVEDKSTS